MDDFSYGQLKDAILSPESVDLIKNSTLVNFLVQNKKYTKKLNKELLEHINNAIDEVLDFARLKASMGLCGYAFIMAMLILEYSNDKELAGKALMLMDQCEEELLPRHIKETLKQYLH